MNDKTDALAERTSQWIDGHARGLGEGLAIALSIMSGNPWGAGADIVGVANHRGGETLDAFTRELEKRGVKL